MRPTSTGDSRSPAKIFCRQSRQDAVSELFSDAANQAKSTGPFWHGGRLGEPTSSASRSAAVITAAATELPETVDRPKIRLRTSLTSALEVLLRSRMAPTIVAVMKAARLPPPDPAMMIGLGQSFMSGHSL